MVVAVGDGEQRRGVRRLAGHRARRHRRSWSRSTGRCRCGSTSWSATGCTTCSSTTTSEIGQPRAGPRIARDEAARPHAALAGPAAGTRRARGRAPDRHAHPGRRRSSASTAPTCCPRSPSSSAGPAATRAVQLLACSGRAADHARGARPDPRRSSRTAARSSPTRTSRCSATASGSSGSRARDRRPPRRAAADLQGGRRGAVPARPGQGGLRHRDPGARHQHAGPHRRAGEAGEVERRDPRRHHAGGVHPAHRAGRAAGHRRRGARRRAVAAGPRPRARGRPRLDPHLPAALVLPADLQHGGQPGRPGRAAHGPRDPRDVLRAVPGRPGGRRAGGHEQVRKQEEALAGYAEAMPATSATSASTPPCGRSCRRWRRRRRGSRPDSPAATPRSPWNDWRPATSSPSRPDAGPGWPWCSTPASTTSASRGRRC